jgi:transposase-like protein
MIAQSALKGSGTVEGERPSNQRSGARHVEGVLVTFEDVKQEVGRWANNRVENSHLPFRRRERAMLRFRQMKSLQKFASVHANVHNHFSPQRHLVDRQTYKERRSAALAEWQILAS